MILLCFLDNLELTSWVHWINPEDPVTSWRNNWVQVSTKRLEHLEVFVFSFLLKALSMQSLSALPTVVNKFVRATEANPCRIFKCVSHKNERFNGILYAGIKMFFANCLSWVSFINCSLSLCGCYCSCHTTRSVAGSVKRNRKWRMGNVKLSQDGFTIALLVFLEEVSWKCYLEITLVCARCLLGGGYEFGKLNPCRVLTRKQGTVIINIAFICCTLFIFYYCNLDKSH